MVAVTLVDEQIDSGQRLIDQLAEMGFIVRAACWVKPVEEDRWTLYIASPAVDEEGSLAAYRQVLDVLRSLLDVSLDSSNLKLVGENSPVGKELVALQRRFPGWKTLGFSPPTLLEWTPLEGVY